MIIGQFLSAALIGKRQAVIDRFCLFPEMEARVGLILEYGVLALMCFTSIFWMLGMLGF